MVIIFQSEKARKQLLEKGCVWSFRTHRRVLKSEGGPVPRRVSYDWAAAHRCGKKICDVAIRNEREIKAGEARDILNYYLLQSGFDTMDEWLGEIIELNKLGSRSAVHSLEDFIHGWIYLVVNLNIRPTYTADDVCER